MRTLLGKANIYRLDDGSISYDQDSLRRTDFSGDVGYDNAVVEFGYDDFDDYTDEDDDSEEDDDSDEFEGDDETDDIGATRGQERRRGRRAGRKRKRASRKRSRADRLEDRADKLDGGRRRSGGSKNVQGTVISGKSSETTAGAVSIVITLNHQFNVDNIVFDGSSSGAMVNSIICGDDLVLNNASGTPVSIFAANNPLRDLFKGERAKLSAAQTIIINGTIANDGDVFMASVIGKKPASRC